MPIKTYRKKLTSALALFLPALCLQGCGESIDARQAELNNGLIYKLHATEPFSGSLEKYTFTPSEVHKLSTSRVNPSALSNCTVPIKKGVRDGMSICKSDSGTKTAEIIFKEGVKVGTEKRWDTNTGKLIMEAEWRSTDKLLQERNYDPATGSKIYEVTWKNWGEVRGVPDGEERYFDLTGKLTNHVIYKDGFAKDAIASTVASAAATVTPAAVPSASSEAPKEIAIIGKTADGKYPIYQLEGDLSDLNYSSPGLIWQPGDLIDRLVYLAPDDVNQGYSCDWVCKDEAKHIVGLNPRLKTLPKQ